MESTTGSAGVAVLALFVIWFAYYVPHRVKQRQQFLDSRVEDRFSGSLRVLGVASGKRERRAPRGHLGPAEGRSLLLGPVVATEPDVGILLRVSDAGEPGPTAPREVQQVTAGGTGHQPSSKEGPQTMENDVRTGDPRPSIPPGRRAEGGFDDPFPPRRAPSASRIALLERRAKAARRRLVLTILLLLATAGAWVAVGFGLVSWYAAAGPTAALVLVLVLGRQAVLAARRADTAWLADRRTAAREAARASRGPVQGSPVAPRNVHPSRVTGHAVRPSQTNTQMIPRVTPADLERGAARGRDRRPATGSTARVEPEPDLLRSRTGASGGELFDDRDREEPVVVVIEAEGASAPTSGSAVPEGTPRSERSAPSTDGEAGDAWEPVPVPRPTYTMKPTASESGVAPVQVAVPVAPAATPRPAPETTVAGVSSAPVAPGVPAVPAVPVSSRPAVPAAGDDKKPRTETLGLDLNEILARRRVSGG
ncbi:hypothetical protein EQW78_08680 [Oerskovia turbata]|uniref:Uncharacterized protein n=1 Tax=Oerskovia turbata TaxID=1713 RepID=A0A4V1N567_9CELL|nr:hypothetical protein [Oerskovia turbata]RXR26873.1 hypothetical protein EQW73_05185 [Oerskovia turbata]RXR34606.1 hypothetical protein EQW78_08680 [Oerskovia turbata]